MFIKVTLFQETLTDHFPFPEKSPLFPVFVLSFVDILDSSQMFDGNTAMPKIITWMKVQQVCNAQHHMGFSLGLDWTLVLGLYNHIFKSSYLQMFYKIDVLKNFTKFTAKIRVGDIFVFKSQVK